MPSILDNVFTVPLVITYLLLIALIFKETESRQNSTSRGEHRRWIYFAKPEASACLVYLTVDLLVSYLFLCHLLLFHLEGEMLDLECVAFVKCARAV